MCRQVLEIVIAKKRGGLTFRKEGVFTRCRHGIWRRWHKARRSGKYFTRECFRGKWGNAYRGSTWKEVPELEVPAEVMDRLYAQWIERGDE